MLYRHSRLLYRNLNLHIHLRRFQGFESGFHDGHPTFENEYTDPVDANEFAANLVKPVFRDGWRLPDMPV